MSAQPTARYATSVRQEQTTMNFLLSFDSVYDIRLGGKQEDHDIKITHAKRGEPHAAHTNLTFDGIKNTEYLTYYRKKVILMFKLRQIMYLILSCKYILKASHLQTVHHRTNASYRQINYKQA